MAHEAKMLAKTQNTKLNLKLFYTHELNGENYGCCRMLSCIKISNIF